MTKKKDPKVEDLIQKFLLAKGKEKQHLLTIIKRILPDFKPPK